MSVQNGGPAFPRAVTLARTNAEWGSAHSEGYGMSLRDYFAAIAMHAALTSAKNATSVEELLLAATTLAYRAADAMLAAREEKP